ALTQRGDISEADALEILKFEGWEPTLAEKVSKAWATTQAAAQKEATVADLLALYDGYKASPAETLAALEALGYPAEEAQAKMDVLDARRVTSARNTAIGDLHGLYKKGGLSDPAVLTALASIGV